jgi:hypothetical protein
VHWPPFFSHDEVTPPYPDSMHEVLRQSPKLRPQASCLGGDVLFATEQTYLLGKIQDAEAAGSSDVAASVV